MDEQKSLGKNVNFRPLHFREWLQKGEIKGLRPTLHSASVRHAADCPLGRLVCGLDHPWFLRKPGGISYHFCGSQVASEALRYHGQLGALWFSMRSLSDPVPLHRTLERRLGFWYALVLRHRNFWSRLVCCNDGPSVRHLVRQVGDIFHIDHSHGQLQMSKVHAPPLLLWFWLLKSGPVCSKLLSREEAATPADIFYLLENFVWLKLGKGAQSGVHTVPINLNCWDTRTRIFTIRLVESLYFQSAIEWYMKT